MRGRADARGITTTRTRWDSVGQSSHDEIASYQSRSSGAAKYDRPNRGLSVVCLFFQAEDGIRDHCVTGVQTCALPISAPLIGDFHYNGHILLTKFPECARALDKYRINPGNVGTGRRRDEQFSTICKAAVEHHKPVRIGVNGGSLNQELVIAKMQENTDRDLGKTSEEIINECMVLSAVQSTELAIESGLRKDQIIISCKTSRPRDLIAVYRELARRTDQPLHLGLTEAGMGVKGLVWSASAMGVLLAEGIGDTIRVSLTPRPGGDRREEVYAACELLQALGLRSFSPSVTACPGCGRTTSTTFQELAERIQSYVRDKMPEWKTQ